MPEEKADDRLRTHPAERFKPTEEVVDLSAAAKALLAEPAPSHQGHRQIALFHHERETLALFCFESGGKMPGHVVDGPVVIHVLEGCLMISTEYAEYQLEAGHLLRLAGGVRHDVTAYEPSRMLLTIFVEGPRSHAESMSDASAKE